MSAPALDYVIVGAGPAGCVLANRLSADARAAVALIEAGEDFPPGTEPWQILDTFGPSAAMDPRFMWPECMVEWQPGVRRRYEQARVVGGGSSINGMWAIRGLPGDYDEWERAGATGWGWAALRPYFIALERDLDFSGPEHGRDGPFPVRRHRREDWPPFCAALARALEARGHAFVADMNADFGDGLCPVPMNSLPERRVSAAMVFLDAVTRRRPNLSIRPRAFAERIVFEGQRAVGVQVRRDGAIETLRARRVVLSAGAYQSPALLLRSGIGPAAQLRALGIGVVHHLPGVGGNLHDHPYAYVACHLKRAGMQDARVRPWVFGALRWSSGLAGAPAADMMMTMLNKTMWHPLGHRIAAAGTSLYKAFSRGEVTLASPDPREHPRIGYRLFSDKRDLARMVTGFKLAYSAITDPALDCVRNETFAAVFSDRVRAIARPARANWWKAAAFAAALDGPRPLRRALIDRFITPGVDIHDVMRSDAAIADYLCANAAGMYHPVGTCRMGAAGDPQAVVGPDGAVHGVAGLTVADASVMPVIPRGNTHFPTMVVAEKIARALAGRPSPERFESAHSA